MSGWTSILLAAALVLAAAAAFLLGGYLTSIAVRQKAVHKRRADGGGFFRTLLLALGETVRPTADVRVTGPARSGPPSGPRLFRPVELEVIERAGLTPWLDEGTLHAVRIRLGVLAAAAFALPSVMAGPSAALLGFVAGGACGFIAPAVWVGREARERKAACEMEVPIMVDVIALSTQAGLSFDGALGAYVEASDSLLAQEVGRAYEGYMQGTCTREAALRGLADRWDSSLLARFAQSVVQALRFGAPLAETLEALAAQTRQEHAALVSTRIARAPVLMLVPMGLLILPAMLLLVLGPVVLDMLSEMG